jgi:TonB family protein
MTLTRADLSGHKKLLMWVALSVGFHAIIVTSIERPTAGAGIAEADLTPQPFSGRLINVTYNATPKASPASLPALSAAPEKSADSLPVSASKHADSPDPSTGTPAAQRGIYYFKTTELDRKPFPLKSLVVPVPDSYDRPDPASVILNIRINEAGTVDHAAVVLSSGARDFEEVAVKTFRNARFNPGYRQGVRVRSEMTIEVTITPPDDT